MSPGIDLQVWAPGAHHWYHCIRISATEEVSTGTWLTPAGLFPSLPPYPGAWQLVAKALKGGAYRTPRLAGRGLRVREVRGHSTVSPLTFTPRHSLLYGASRDLWLEPRAFLGACTRSAEPPRLEALSWRFWASPWCPS